MIRKILPPGFLFCCMFFLGYGVTNGQRSPELKLTCPIKEIQQGDSIVVSWVSSKADSVVFTNIGKQIPLSGELTLFPDSSEKYLFVAYRKKKGSKKKRLNITVNPPKIISFSMPESVSDEESFRMNWIVRDAEVARIDGINDSLPVSGEMKYRIDTSRSFRLTATNQFGIEVSMEKEIIMTYVEELFFPEQVMQGDTILVTWKYKNTKEVRIEGIDTVFSNIDTLRIAPDSSIMFHLYAFRNNGDSLTQTILTEVITPSIVYFEGTKNIFPGEEAIIKWKVIGVDSVNIIGLANNLPPEGSRKIKPGRTEKYVLVVPHRDKNEERSHTVNVIIRRYIINKTDVKNVSNGTRIDFEVYNTDLVKYPKEIKLYVLAVDSSGNFVSGLAPPYGSEAIAKKYFKSLVETLANGNKHKVEDFKVVEIQENVADTCSISLTLDYSGSMSGVSDDLEKACMYYVKKKRDIDSVSIVKFDEDLSLELPLTTDEKSIKRAVNAKQLDSFGGGTALYAAVDEGLSSLKSSRKNKQMVLITDGYENSSIVYFGTRAIFAQQVAKKAKFSHIKINVVTIGRNVNEPLLKFLSVITGGNYYNLMNHNDILNVMTELPMISRNYYLITYKPTLINGSRKLTLVYNNNAGETKETNREVFVGNDFDLSEFESSSESYWVDSKFGWKNKIPISTPQVIANFDFGKYRISEEQFQRLDKFIEFMKKDSTACVTIIGHTDLVGKEKDCMVLSLRRAQQVSEYMKNKGIDPKRMKEVGDGKNHPIWSTGDEPWKARENRRVEIILYK